MEIVLHQSCINKQLSEFLLTKTVANKNIL